MFVCPFATDPKICRRPKLFQGLKLDIFYIFLLSRISFSSVSKKKKKKKKNQSHRHFGRFASINKSYIILHVVWTDKTLNDMLLSNQIRTDYKAFKNSCVNVGFRNITTFSMFCYVMDLLGLLYLGF